MTIVGVQAWISRTKRDKEKHMSEIIQLLDQSCSPPVARQLVRMIIGLGHMYQDLGSAKRLLGDLKREGSSSL